MQGSLKRTVLKNASVNVVRLVGSGVPALLLPPFLVRRLSTDEYGAWVLILQLTIYMGMLDFGIQTAVARFVAHGDELKDESLRDGIVTTAVILLSALGVIGALIVLGLAWQVGNVFPSMPKYLASGARTGILLMGESFALGLPFSAMLSIFIGLQRNEIPATITVGSRFLIAVSVAVIVLKHGGLVEMACGVALCNVLSYVATYAAWRKWAAHVRIHLSLASRQLGKEIATYCASAAAWAAGLIMVSGLDLTIVGVFDYPATAYYAVAATLSNFLTLGQSSVFGALLPASAVLNARGDADRLGLVLTDATRYGMFLLLVMSVPFILAGRFVLRLWVGPTYAANSLLFAQILVLANVIRLSALPYATLLLGTGEQRKVILSPLAEGIANLAASVLGAWKFGAIGVAIGTLIGSFVSVAFHFLYNLPRTTAIRVNRRRLLTQGILKPVLCACPFVLVFLGCITWPGISPNMKLYFSCAAAFFAGALFWNYGLVGSERRGLAQVFRVL